MRLSPIMSRNTASTGTHSKAGKENSRSAATVEYFIQAAKGVLNGRYHDHSEWNPSGDTSTGKHAVAVRIAERSGVERSSIRLRAVAVRLLFGFSGRQRSPFVGDGRQQRGRQSSDDPGGARVPVGDAERPAGGGGR